MRQKPQSVHWKTHELLEKESLTKHIQVQGYVNYYCDIKTVIMEIWVSDGVTMNQDFYRKFVETL